MTQHTRLRVGSVSGSKLPALLLLVQIVTPILAEYIVKAIAAQDLRIPTSIRLPVGCHKK